MQRVVSLIASATEIVCALGLEQSLVGRSHECDYPASVGRLPVCTEPKFNVEGSSFEIDQRVKGILQEGLSVYRVHADVLRQLRPDVIVTQTQCEVCAVSQRDVEEAVCQWMDGRPQVVALAPNCLADVWVDMAKVAEVLDVADGGLSVVSRLQQRMARITEKAKALTHRPTVACLEWIKPLMSAGNWTPELVEMAGGRNLFGSAGQHAPWMSWEELHQADPEIIFVMPCGFDIERSMTEMPLLGAEVGWHEMRAVREDRVFVVDGNQYFNRPGPRLVESLEILAELLHPREFDFEHEGSGWQRWRGASR
jgi:iron complex transport system substrate-binding protein